MRETTPICTLGVLASPPSPQLKLSLFSGGKNAAQNETDIFYMPLFWMKHEAMIADLRFNPNAIKWSWDLAKVSANTEKTFPKSWWLFEYWPVLQLKYTDSTSKSR